MMIRIYAINQSTSIESEVFVAPSAAVIGEVSIKSKSSVINVD
jgi:carbonic anhydrase/acetyltransferase-like protein (isoleucine patch superfamily)